MTYGTIKVDTVTFTDAGVDKSVTLSGLVQNPTFSGNVTVTGTLSGVTVTGTTANFTSGNFTNISGGTHTITSGVFASGSAASPSITFTGDLNTGIYSPGADQVAISTGGTGKLFIDASGNVLIGETGAASRLLTVNQTGTTGGEYGIRVSQLSATSNAIDITIDSANGVSKLFQKSTVPLLFGTNDTERLRITSTGTINIVGAGSAGVTQAVSFNGSAPVDSLVLTSGGLVGVGTSSPSQSLQVVGAIASTGQAPALTSSSTFFDYIAALNTARFAAVGNTTGTPAPIYFSQYSSNGSVGRDAVAIDSSGRLLVGTSSDSGGALLQVNGDRIRVGTAKTPASATATGTAGEICWDASYVYVCTATNTWKRSALSTW